MGYIRICTCSLIITHTRNVYNVATVTGAKQLLLPVLWLACGLGRGNWPLTRYGPALERATQGLQNFTFSTV